MKLKIFILILLLIPMLSFGQHWVTKKSVTSLAFDIGHVVLDATGDALMDSGSKEWGHAFNAASVGLLVSQPFIIDFERSDWKWKLPAYICTRFALFNLTYNLINPNIDNIYYFGNTEITDKVFGKMMSGKSQLLPKGIAFTFAVSITLRYGNNF